MILGTLLSLLIGLAIGFAVGRRTATPAAPSGTGLAVQHALDAQKAQLAHALSSHREQLAQLEASVADIRHRLDEGARELVGELPPVRVETSRLSRPETGSGQPRDYADQHSGLLRQRPHDDD